jgi:hypothetical protein
MMAVQAQLTGDPRAAVTAATAVMDFAYALQQLHVLLGARARLPVQSSVEAAARDPIQRAHARLVAQLNSPEFEVRTIALDPLLPCFGHAHLR